MRAVAMSERAATELPLCSVRLEVIEAGGRLAQTLGMPRSLGQIYGLLYLATEPLPLDGIAETLQISKASVSTGTRQLASLGAIRQIWIQGERRDHYEAVSDFKQLLQGVYNEFLKPRLRGSDRRIVSMSTILDKDLRSGTITAAEHKLMSVRLKELSKLQKKVEKWLPLAEKLL